MTPRFPIAFNVSMACAVQWACLLLVIVSCQSTNGQNHPPTDSNAHLNWELKTLGGKQFWTDMRVAGSWRVQHNSETGHYRLIDGNDVRHAWGTRAACQAMLNKKVIAGVVQPCSGKIVILLHGLARSSDSMVLLANAFRSRGYQTINFRYASTRRNIHQHALALRSVIDRLGPFVTEINFVGHSMGNIVVRRYLGGVNGQPVLKSDPRIASMVMLGPPNHGSIMARLLQNSLTFKLVAGASGQQLGRKWKDLAPLLAIPNFRFGIIAGGQSLGSGVDNFLIPGQDDFTVGVAEAQLPGATDLIVAPLLHSTMMIDRDALLWSVNFVQHGYFVSDQSRNPIP